jgi:His/Glu/Gln/Arg/opine family amino acid ABC transporter permease subunit
MELKSILFIAEGVKITLIYSALSIIFGLMIGSLLAAANLSPNRLFNKLSILYVSVFRGTPLLLQLSLIYFAVPIVTGFQFSAFAAGILAFSLNSGAYVSEIIRSGILSIDKGQAEAAAALGCSSRMVMLDIILPQAFRRILPALVNEIVNLTKESAIISVIGESDLMRRAQLVAAEKYDYLTPLLIAGVCYYILVSCLTFLAYKLENKLKII